MPELDDYSAPILIQDLEFHLDLFSPKFLAKVASIHQDTLCEREATLCSRLHGFPRNTCVIPKKPAAGFKGVAPGEPVCIMQYKRADPMT